MIEMAIDLGMLAGLSLFFTQEIRHVIRESILFAFEFLTGKKPSLARYPYALTSGLVFLTAIPSGIIHFVFSDLFMSQLLVAGIGWVIMGFLLCASRFSEEGNRTAYEMNHQDAFLIGLMRSAAVIPGFSALGFSLLGSLSSGIERSEAVRFSFLIFIPALVGRLLFKPWDGTDFVMHSYGLLAAYFAVAAVAGYLAVWIVVKLTESRKLFIFGFYCLLTGLLALFSQLAGALVLR